MSSHTTIASGMVWANFNACYWSFLLSLPRNIMLALTSPLLNITLVEYWVWRARLGSNVWVLPYKAHTPHLGTHRPCAGTRQAPWKDPRLPSRLHLPEFLQATRVPADPPAKPLTRHLTSPSRPDFWTHKLVHCVCTWMITSMLHLHGGAHTNDDRYVEFT